VLPVEPSLEELYLAVRKDGVQGGLPPNESTQAVPTRSGGVHRGLPR
jgi:hypothetical protein